jgi:hypothetical protein
LKKNGKLFNCYIITSLVIILKNVSSLLDEKDNIKFILTNKSIAKAISDYVNVVSDYVNIVGEVNMHENMTVNRLKKEFCCPDQKRVLKQISSTTDEKGVLAAHEKHKEIYSGKFRYPAQYYVFLGLMLRCFMMMAAPNESGKQARVIMKDLIRQAY